MPLPVQGLVGPTGPSVAGSPQQLRFGPTGELVANDGFGKYYEMTRLGLVFTACGNVAGSALLTATSTTTSCAIYNPPTSGKRAILIKTALGYVSGTGTAGAIVYSINTSPVNTVSGTAMTITNNLNPPVASSLIQAFTTATVTAMTLLRPAKYSQVIMPATATWAPFQLDEDFDGSIVVNPGGAFGIGGNVALGTVVIYSVSWIELPNVSGT